MQMMKASAFALAILVSTVQTVGWVECCCVLICKHHNDPCRKECKNHQAAAAPADCCSKHSEQPASKDDEKRCSHVEPSSEVVAQSAALPPIIFDLVLELPIVLLPEVTLVRPTSEPPRWDSRGSPPLHLLYSVLLI